MPPAAHQRASAPLHTRPQALLPSPPPASPLSTLIAASAGASATAATHAQQQLAEQGRMALAVLRGGGVRVQAALVATAAAIAGPGQQARR